MMSTLVKHGLLLINYWPYGNLTSDKSKWEFFQAVAMWVQLYDCTTYTLTKYLEKNLNGTIHRSCFEQILETAPSKTAVVWPLTSHHINHQSNTNKTCWALLQKLGHSDIDSYTSTHLSWPNQQNLTFISFEWTLDTV